MPANAPPRTFSSREFAHDLARVKRAAAQGPVLITDRGQPRFALLAIDQYWELTGHQAPGQSLLDAMQSLPSTAGVDLKLPARRFKAKPADLD